MITIHSGIGAKSNTGVWGTPTWVFVHTLCTKLKEESFWQMKDSILFFLARIWSLLPCPDCASHAVPLWQQMQPERIRSKEDLEMCVLSFHNRVNHRLNKPMFPPEVLQFYQSQSLIQMFANFHRVFQTRGNMQMLTESFQRDQLMLQLRQWLRSSAMHFVQ